VHTHKDINTKKTEHIVGWGNELHESPHALLGMVLNRVNLWRSNILGTSHWSKDLTAFSLLYDCMSTSSRQAISGPLASAF